MGEHDVLVCGSEGGQSLADYFMTKQIPRSAGLIVNDAGIGKEESGIRALSSLEQLGVRVAAVSSSSARIGDGADVFENGVISVVNRLASECGVRPGMSTKEAAMIMLGEKPEKPPVRYIEKSGVIDRVIVTRLRPGSEVFPSLLDLCRKHQVSAGVILSMIGSLRKAAVVLPRLKGDNVVYSEPVVFEGPLELLSGKGHVAKDGDKLWIHLHVIFADPKGHVYGGHMHTEGNIVLATLDVTIGALKGIRLERMVDVEVGVGTMWVI